MDKDNGVTITESASQPQALVEELRNVLGFVERHRALFTAWAILIPSIAVYHYTAAEHVPLSVASPDIISSLPSVLASIALFVIAIAAALLSPITLMFEDASRDADGRLRILSRDKSQPGKSVLRWLGALSLPGLLIAAGVAFQAFVLPNSKWVISVTAATASLLFACMVRYRKDQLWGRLLSSDTPLTMLMSLVQMLISISAMQVALKPFGQSPSTAQFLLAAAMALVLLPILQMFAATLIEITSKRYGFAKQAFYAALLLITTACIFPATGSKLAGHVIGGSASGYTDCSQLRLIETSEAFRDLMEGGGTSAPLKVLSHASGTYLVRKIGDVQLPVYRIPDSNVAALITCPKESIPASGKSG